MKKNFFTGLAILLPFVLSLVIFFYLVNIVTRPFEGVIANILVEFHVFSSSTFLGVDVGFIVKLISKIIALFLVVTITLLVGILGEMVIGNYLVGLGEFFLNRTPFVKSLYPSIKEVVQTLLKPNAGMSFSQVVLAPFPHSSVYCIGFLSEQVDLTGNPEETIRVFILEALNPSVGILLAFPRRSLVFTSLTPEDALKFVMSCGTIRIV